MVNPEHDPARANEQQQATADLLHRLESTTVALRAALQEQEMSPALQSAFDAVHRAMSEKGAANLQIMHLHVETLLASHLEKLQQRVESEIAESTSQNRRHIEMYGGLVDGYMELHEQRMSAHFKRLEAIAAQIGQAREFQPRGDFTKGAFDQLAVAELLGEEEQPIRVQKWIVHAFAGLSLLSMGFLLQRIAGLLAQFGSGLTLGLGILILVGPLLFRRAAKSTESRLRELGI